jgi:DNA-binding response OmpR family regulator
MAKILVVDDDHSIVQLLKTNLESFDHIITGAYDGIEALEIAQKILPDLIILDYMLPRLDGFSVCRVLKGNYPTRSIPVIILTARNQIDDKVYGWESGADEFITKPFNFRELHARITSLLKIKELENKLASTDKQKAISEMIMNINHEINNPLAAIITHIDLIFDNTKEINQQTLLKYLEIIKIEAFKIRDITHKLSELSQELPNDKISPSIKTT